MNANDDRPEPDDGGTGESASASDHSARKPRSTSVDGDAVLPTVTRDEMDVGWGDEPGERDDAWYQRERPPHHE